jgi:hypothetical protein
MHVRPHWSTTLALLWGVHGSEQAPFRCKRSLEKRLGLGVLASTEQHDGQVYCSKQRIRMLGSQYATQWRVHRALDLLGLGKLALLRWGGGEIGRARVRVRMLWTLHARTSFRPQSQLAISPALVNVCA